MSQYEQWLVKNATGRAIAIGDLPLIPTIEPNQAEDLLRYYNSSEISQSGALRSLLKSGELVLHKKKSERQSSKIGKRVASSAVASAQEYESGNNTDLKLYDDLRTPLSSVSITGVNPPIFARFINDGESPIGNAIKIYSGDSSYGQISNLPLGNSNNEFSVDFFIKHDDASINFTQYVMSRADDLFEIRLDSGDRITFEVNGDSSGSASIGDSNDVQLTESWHHVAATFKHISGNTYELALYFDGNVKHTGQGTFTFSGNPLTSNTFLGIRNDLNDQRTVQADFDELRFWDRALLPDEVNTLYNDGNGYPDAELDSGGIGASLVANYHFDETEGSTAEDSVGTYDMTIVGAEDTDWIEGVVSGGGTPGVFGYLFSPVIRNEVFFDIQLPHSWVVGTNIQPHVHWSPMDNSSGVVRFGLEYTLADINGTFSLTKTIYGSESVLSGEKYKHHMTSLGWIDMSSTTYVSAMLICRLFRDATHEDDTYDGQICVHEFDAHYQVGSDPGTPPPIDL